MDGVAPIVCAVWSRSRMMNNSVKGFFFEKKKQKTFGPAGRGDAGAGARRTRRFFGYFFFKKSNFFLHFNLARLREGQ
jgi:hypothetical protein